MIEPRGWRTSGPATTLLARATRAGALALGLELFGDPDERSTVVTAIELPGDIDGAKVPGALRRLGITANGGQDQLKGRILRIAHCGYFGAFDILTSLSGLEIALQQLGHDVEHGAGVGAAQRVFLEAGVLRRGVTDSLGEQLPHDPRRGADRRLGRRPAARAVRGRPRRRLVRRRAGGADRRLPRDPDPLGDAADADADRARATT